MKEPCVIYFELSHSFWAFLILGLWDPIIAYPSRIRLFRPISATLQTNRSKKIQFSILFGRLLFVSRAEVNVIHRFYRFRLYFKRWFEIK